MKITYILRFLCFLVDLVVVLFVVQIIALGLLNVRGFRAEFMFMIFFGVYNIGFSWYMKGRTPGKALGKLLLVDVDCFQESVSILPLCMREAVKAFYLFPIIGWFICLVSIIMMIFSGRTLHDLVGRSMVIFIRNQMS